MVAGDGFEPSTFGLWARRATRLLHPASIFSNNTFNGTGIISQGISVNPAKLFLLFHWGHDWGKNSDLQTSLNSLQVEWLIR